MLSELSIFTLTLLPSLISTLHDSSVNYTSYKTITTHNHDYLSLTFTPDYSLAIFYSISSPNTAIFNPYGWQPFPSTDFYNFHRPVFITAFIDPATNSTNILQSTDQSQIYLKTFSKNEQYRQILLFDKGDDDYFEKVVVSSDGTKWAAFWQMSDSVYVGNMVEPNQKPTIVKYLQGFLVKDAAWKPNSSILVVCTENPQKNNPIFTYNAENKQYLPLPINKELVYNMAFTPDGIFYFLQGNSTKRNFTCTLNSYNFTSNKITAYPLNFQPYRILIRGRFLSLWKISLWFIFPLNSEKFNDGGQLYKLKGDMNGQFMSPEGNFIVSTQLSTSNIFQIYKLCNEDMLYYDRQQETCNICSPRCGECLRQANLCVSCAKETYYLVSNHTCLPCGYLSPHCLTCRSASNQMQCTLCEQQYILFNNSCSLCHELVDGCKECKFPSQCSVCHPGYVLDEQNQCQICQQILQGCNQCISLDQCLKCSQYYILTDKTCTICSSAILGCLLCVSPSECLTCTDNFTLNPRTRHCDDKDTTGQNGDSSTLIVIVCVGTAVGVALILAVTVIVVLRIKGERRRWNLSVRRSLAGSSLNQQEKEQSRVYEGGYLIPQ